MLKHLEITSINLKEKKMKRNLLKLFGFVFLSILIVSCTKTENESSTTLKSAINESSQNLNTAMNAIVVTNAYKVFTVTSSPSSSSVSKSSAASSVADSIYDVYIPLEDIKGVYNYKPATNLDHWGNPLLRYFVKTADDSKMIVNMPLQKVKNPWTLRNYKPADSTLANNFTIAVSDYHNNYNNYHDFDYNLESEITIDNVKSGNLSIYSFKSPTLGVKYASQFAFNGSYTAKYKYESGDTTVSSFTILGSDKVLYEEKLLTIKNDTARFGREHQYILTIGDVQIVRKSAVQKAEVYLNGVLQPNAVITIVDKVADSEASVCKKREVQITFEDGTTATISSLIGSSIDNIKTLFDSLHQVYFAAYVVDWIAYDIYYKR